MRITLEMTNGRLWKLIEALALSDEPEIAHVRDDIMRQAAEARRRHEETFARSQRNYDRLKNMLAPYHDSDEPTSKPPRIRETYGR